MAKSGVDAFPALSIARKGSFYSAVDVTAIVAAVNLKLSAKRRRMLHKRLELAAERWANASAMQRAPTASMLSKRFEAIENAATNLLSKLGTGPAGAVGKMPPALIDRIQLAASTKATRLEVGSISLLRGSVSGIVQIRRWSKRIAQEEKDRHKKAGLKKQRNAGDKALRQWIVELANIYESVGWGPPGVSLSDRTKKYSGPFFRFVGRAAKGVVRIDRSNQALGKFIQRAL
jgi:hypothetical protein